MRAMRLEVVGSGTELREAEVNRPQPGRDEVLVRVYAAGVTPTELLWYPTTHGKDGSARHQATPGHEFSGVIAAVGEAVTDFLPGQEVFGMNDWFAEGATAEYCVALAASLAPKPMTLTHEEAATVPISALTAWQGLFERTKVLPGERVLVQGGAGSVGLFVVQMAHLRGAHVIATASGGNLALMRELGADEAIDYRTNRFEDLVRDVDVLFDTVGGDTHDRARGVMRAGGRMVSIAADVEETTDPLVKATFFIVEPNQGQLGEVAKMLDAGRLKTFVKAEVSLADADKAYRGRIEGAKGYGKVVISMMR